MNCPNCGGEIQENSAFCLTCGAKLADPAAESSVPVSVPGETADFSGEYYGESGAAPASQSQTPAMAPVISLGNWLGTMALWMGIQLAMAFVTGIVGAFLGFDNIAAILLQILTGVSSLIFAVVCAFHKAINPSKRNFFRAYLIAMVAVAILVFVLLVVFVVVVAAAAPMDELEELLRIMSI